jgi:hypothetical protein
MDELERFSLKHEYALMMADVRGSASMRKEK